ncbi:sugar ABC transporter permease [Chloroflexi bacterium TSY]|nr:sugar ABC transporter permease [Chloroflexi bacterium TSY]
MAQINQADSSTTTNPVILSPTSLTKTRWRSYRIQEIGIAYLFILPTLLGFLIFVLGPVVAGLALSFSSYDLFSPPRLTGLENFQVMWTDVRFWQIFGNSILYAVGLIVLDMIWAMALALAIHSYIPRILKLIFRAVFFFPILTSGAVIAIVWQYLFNADLGVINYYLQQIGGVVHFSWIDRFTLLETERTFIFSDFAGSQRENGLI